MYTILNTAQKNSQQFIDIKNVSYNELLIMRAAIIKYIHAMNKSNKWIHRILRIDALEEMEYKNWLISHAENTLFKINNLLQTYEGIN